MLIPSCGTSQTTASLSPGEPPLAWMSESGCLPAASGCAHNSIILGLERQWVGASLSAARKMRGGRWAAKRHCRQHPKRAQLHCSVAVAVARTSTRELSKLASASCETGIPKERVACGVATGLEGTEAEPAARHSAHSRLTTRALCAALSAMHLALLQCNALVFEQGTQNPLGKALWHATYALARSPCPASCWRCRCGSFAPGAPAKGQQSREGCLI